MTHSAPNYIFPKSESAKTSSIMKCLYIYICVLLQRLKPLRFLLSPPPVRRCSARRSRPVLLALAKREPNVTSHTVEVHTDQTLFSHCQQVALSRGLPLLCPAVFRSHVVVRVGGELLAGLVPERVWSPLPRLRTKRSGWGGTVQPEPRGFPGPDS